MTSLRLLLILGVLMWAVTLQAGCVGNTVNSFGAKGDGHTDDTAAIQAAINAAAASGGGSVVFNVARYYTTGTLTVPNGVVLCGAVQGPFDVISIDPANVTIAPTLLVTNTSSNFITLSGDGSGVVDILFHYPNQVQPTASSPISYPYTIKVAQGGAKVERCTVTNAYQFMDVEAGRTTFKDLIIGAYFVGIFVDHVADHTTFDNIFNQVMWDIAAGVPYPSPIDTWVLNNAYAMTINRADSIEIHDFAVYSRYCAFFIKDSPDISQNPRNAYGSASDVDLDTIQYGIIAQSTNQPGFKLTNVDFGAATLNGSSIGKAAVYFQSGGTHAPYVQVLGGSIRGSWTANPPFASNSVPGSKLPVHYVIGYDE